MPRSRKICIPSIPTSLFLPADLFDPKGPWCSRRGGVGYVATQGMCARYRAASVSLSFIRVPRRAGKQRFPIFRPQLYCTPWRWTPAEIATSYPSRGGALDTLRCNAGNAAIYCRDRCGARQAADCQSMTSSSPCPYAHHAVRQFALTKNWWISRTNAACQLWQLAESLRPDNAASDTALPAGQVAFTRRRLTRRKYRLRAFPMGISRKELLVRPVVLIDLPAPSAGRHLLSHYLHAISITGGTQSAALACGESQYQIEAAVGWKTQQFNWGYCADCSKRRKEN